ncbi:hypothetical protein GCM10025867_43020 [Frondihabitans sucicola]|uniref:Phage holin family protein n=1 Tax=Frondihabitans sucicola TaxID=1268041 RepID=A0ABN6Y4I7_9MICO|nr:hypothetical protein [Frondihabitans sucicola]BDZ52061.1 hypothetical protein GCM10025867_43020 [Frondihabitans sucicola]
MNGNTQIIARIMRIVSAVLLLAVGVIHLFLVFDGVGGLLGVLFVLNGIAGVVLAIAVAVLRARLLRVAVILSLLFLIASFLSIVFALTVGLFGITETWSYTLVPETVVIEAVGIVVTALTTVLVFRGERAARTAV